MKFLKTFGTPCITGLFVIRGDKQARFQSVNAEVFFKIVISTGRLFVLTDFVITRVDCSRYIVRHGQLDILTEYSNAFGAENIDV